MEVKLKDVETVMHCMAELRKFVRRHKRELGEDYDQACKVCCDGSDAIRKVHDAVKGASDDFDEDDAKTELDIVRGWME